MTRGGTLAIPEAVCVYPSGAEKPYVMYRIRQQRPGATYTADHRYSEFLAFHKRMQRLKCPKDEKAACECKRISFGVGKIWGAARNFDLKRLASRKAALEQYVRRLDAAHMCSAHCNAFMQFIEPQCRLIDDVTGAENVPDLQEKKSVWAEGLPVEKNFSTFAAHGFALQVYGSAYCRVGGVRCPSAKDAAGDVVHHQLLVHHTAHVDDNRRMRRGRRHKASAAHAVESRERLLHVRDVVRTVAACLRSTMVTTAFPNAATLAKAVRVVSSLHCCGSDDDASSTVPASPTASVSPASPTSASSCRTDATDDSVYEDVGITVTRSSFRGVRQASSNSTDSDESFGLSEASSCEDLSSPRAVQKHYLTVPKCKRSDKGGMQTMRKSSRSRRAVAA